MLWGLWVEPSEWESNTSGPSTYFLFFFPLHFPSPFSVDPFTCAHATHEKRKISIYQFEKGRILVAIGSAFHQSA